MNLPQRTLKICIHTTPLTFDLTSDQEKKLPKKGITLEESNRGGSPSRMDRATDVMCPVMCDGGDTVAAQWILKRPPGADQPDSTDLKRAASWCCDRGPRS